VNWPITEAEPCDAVAINRVVNLAYRVEDFFKNGDRTDVREVAEYLVSEAFLVARNEDDDIVGAVRVSVHEQRGHFGMLSVDPAYQGTGLGRALIHAAERYCSDRACTWMDLEVVNHRIELPDLYRRFGYEISGEAPWPDDAMEELKMPAHFIVMSKQLTPALEESLG
jgi:ribosomal protein S18 acetylase RimI-like enzyme